MVTGGLDPQGLPVDLIEGGAQRGGNLFHSFLEFNVDAADSVYFANPDDVSALLVRVTGMEESDINGRLGVRGTADLFLVNPNGISFGENVILDIDGSFHATTADAVPLGSAGLFSASDPDGSTLLEIEPQAVFFDYLSNDSGRISNAGDLQVEGDLTLAGGDLRLSGPLTSGGNMRLVGGSVRITDNAFYRSGGFFDARQTRGFRATLNARRANNRSPHNNLVVHAGGDVVFKRYQGGSLQILSGGQVRIDDFSILGAGRNPEGVASDPTALRLSDPDFAIALDPEQRPTVDIRAGIDPAILGLTDVPAESRTDGAIEIRKITMRAADGLIFMTNQFAADGTLPSSDIDIRDITGNDSNDRFQGNGADVFIDSQAGVNVIEGRLETSSRTGQPGDIVILADGQLHLRGNTRRQDRRSLFGIYVRNRGVFDPSDIYVHAGSILIEEGAQISMNSFGAADAGAVIVIADGDILLSGDRDSRFQGARVRARSGITNFIDRFSIDDRPDSAPLPESGGIQITARNLTLEGGAQIQSRTLDRAEGNSGLVEINVQDQLTLRNGVNADGDTTGGSIISSIEKRAVGQAGGITINTGRFIATGGSLQSNTLGVGDGGTVTLTARELIFLDGISILTRVTAASRKFEGAFGDAGDVRLSAPVIRLVRGGRIRSNTENVGDAGDVFITADLLEITGQGRCDNPVECTSGVNTQVSENATGDGGDIRIEVGQLRISDNGILNATTEGNGPAGQIIIIVDDLEMGTGGRVTTTTEGTGDAGQISVTVAGDASIRGNSQIASRAAAAASGDSGVVNVRVGDRLLLAQGGRISVRNQGSGSGGRLAVRADELLVDGGSLDGTTTGSGTASEIVVLVDDLQLINRGEISTSTSGSADAGRIEVRVAGDTLMDNNSRISSSGTEGALGNSGDVDLEVGGRLTLRNRSGALVSNQGAGAGGNLEVSAENLVMERGARLSAETDSNQGGNIGLSVGELILLRDGSQISATAGRDLGAGDGGNIDISTGYIVAIPGENSDISANAFEGRGGRVNVEADGIFGIEPRPELTPLSDITASSERGVTGSIDILSPDTGFIQNELTELPDALVNSEALISTSCIAQEQDSAGTFVVTGQDGLTLQPGGAAPRYSLGEVQAVEPEAAATLVEPDALYQLADGRRVISRSCGDG